YAPASNAGRGLLGHELTHTIQQRGGGRSSPSDDPNGPVEMSARAACRGVATGGVGPSAIPASGIGLLPRGTRVHPAAQPFASRPVVVQRTCGGGTSWGGCDCADCEKRDADGPAVATKPARGGRP